MCSSNWIAESRTQTLYILQCVWYTGLRGHLQLQYPEWDASRQNINHAHLLHKVDTLYDLLSH